MSKKGKTKYDYYKRCIICDSYYIDYSGSNNKCRKCYECRDNNTKQNIKSKDSKDKEGGQISLF